MESGTGEWHRRLVTPNADCNLDQKNFESFNFFLSNCRTVQYGTAGNRAHTSYSSICSLSVEFWPSVALLLHMYMLRAPAPFANTIAIEAIKGKDLGVLALRRIEIGENFLVERPLVKFTHDASSGKRNAKYFGDDAHRQLLTLAKNAIVPGGSDLANVINTNGYIGENGSVRHSLTFLTISRINHSCLPNAELIVSMEPSELGVVKCIRPIAPGDEITIDYGASGSRQERQRHLRKAFRFDCSCELCVSELRHEQGAMQRPGGRERAREQHRAGAARVLALVGSRS